MKVIVAGTVRVPPENVEKLRPHMHIMLAASRAEDGCETYSYGFDAKEPGLVRVFEIWRDRDALNAHIKAPHMAPWRAAGTELGVSDRRLSLYEVASETALG